MAYSINFKGEKKKDDNVKITLTFYKSGSSGVPKVIDTTGPFDKWDNENGFFLSTTTELVRNNGVLQKLKDSYIQVAEQWESENREWG